MTRLEFFESGQAQEAMNMGIVSEAMFARFIRYKCYRNLRDTGTKKKRSMIEAAEITCCSYTIMTRAVKFFEGSENCNNQ